MVKEIEPPNQLRILALTAGAYREQLRAKHPVVKDSQLVITPGIEMVLAMVKDALDGRKSGICFYAEPDMGKTSVSKVIAQVLRRDYPNMPVYRMTAKPHDGFNEKMQWTDVAAAMSLALAHTAQLIMSDIVSAIRTAAQASDSDGGVAVFITDEGQHWGPQQWKYMKGLCNELADPDSESEHEPVRLVPLTLAQPEMQNIIDAIEALHNQGRDLKKRFFTPTKELVGIRTKEELKALAKQYDDAKFTNYPPGSDVCYTEFFLPLAYAAGLRLENEVDMMWAALKSEKSAGYTAIRGFSLDRVFLAFKRFLMSASARDAANFKSTPTIWREAVTGKQTKAS